MDIYSVCSSEDHLLEFASQDKEAEDIKTSKTKIGLSTSAMPQNQNNSLFLKLSNSKT